MFDFVWIFSIIPVIIVIAVISTIVGSVLRAAKMGKKFAEEIPEIIFPSKRKDDKDVEEVNGDDKPDNELEKKRLELETLKMKKEMQEQENKRVKCDYCGTLNKAKNDKCSGCGADIKHN